MNEQPGTLMQLRLEPPFLTSECLSPCSSVPQPPLFWAGHSHRAVHLVPRRKKARACRWNNPIHHQVPVRGNLLRGDANWLFHTFSDTTRLPSHVIKMTYSKSTRSFKSQKNAICNMTIWTRGFHPISRKAILNFQKWVGILCLMKQPGQVLKNTLMETI